MQTMQIKIAQYIGSQYGGDIMGELKMTTEFVLNPPKYPQSAENCRAQYEAMIRAQKRKQLTL
jgi:hypothetical protein